jgi:hypothetical protein
MTECALVSTHRIPYRARSELRGTRSSRSKRAGRGAEDAAGLGATCHA